MGTKRDDRALRTAVWRGSRLECGREESWALSVTSEHRGVLVEEALAALAVEAGGYYVDATFGRGGHTARLLEAVGGQGCVLAIDQDPQAIAAGHARFANEMRLALV